MSELIVNLEEFASLVGVTAETMRGHIRAVEGAPVWLIERGDRGRGYQIEATGGVAWWQAKRDADEQVDAERRAKLQQMRFDLTGGAVEPTESLTLSGRQRREEYGAAMEALKLRKLMGELVERGDIEHELSQAVVAMRRRLQRVPAEFVIAHGLDQALVRPLKTMIGKALDEFVAAIAVVDVVSVPETEEGGDAHPG